MKLILFELAFEATAFVPVEATASVLQPTNILTLIGVTLAIIGARQSERSARIETLRVSLKADLIDAQIWNKPAT